MIVQVFNSGVVSGPETLVFPAVPLFHEPHVLLFLVETRRGPSGRAPLEYARARGLRVEAVEVKSRFDRHAVGKLRDSLRRLSPRIVHAHDVKATTYSWLTSRGEAWKLVSTHHGVLGRPDWKTKVYENFYSRFVLKKVSAAIVVSRDDERTLLERGLDPRRLVYVANGITRRKWSGTERDAERARLRSKLAEELPTFRTDDILIGIVARLSREKRHSYLLRTLAALGRANPALPWRLVAVGSGALEGRLKSEAAELGIESRVHWLGYRDDASSLMPAFDLLALTSSAEGLPISALEAGWAGVPLFASDVGALPELVSSGERAGGAIFPREQDFQTTAKLLASLLERREQLGRMGMQLQNRVAGEFSAEAWVARMEAVYRSV